jgi:hypothetical protein
MIGWSKMNKRLPDMILYRKFTVQGTHTVEKIKSKIKLWYYNVDISTH